MKVTTVEYMDKLRNYINNDNSDIALELLEDFTDSFTEQTDNSTEIRELKEEIARIDNAWREKYKNRFFTDVKTEDDEVITTIIEDKKYRYEDLFDEGV